MGSSDLDVTVSLKIQDWIQDHRMASLEDNDFNIQKPDQFYLRCGTPYANFSWDFFFCQLQLACY